ncbi:hypothetical protein BD626DRAFT_514348 [Schizophyllum amplum]|uniref:Ribosome biogenesis protein NSA1 n=1 Tax=Schizophyllum amplum TaxID=97359 RepID=A0A550BYD7_9AGAR|nr:hypothetical protein BD626DRAFT_514348 [Auriculariopsis ampla]
MARFILGDELGNLKTLRYPSAVEGEAPQLKIVHQGSSRSSTRSVQALAVNASEESTIVAAGYSNGSAAMYSLDGDDTIDVLSEWKEPRFKQQYVGLGILPTSRSVISCTANGALRRTNASAGQEADVATLPARLCDWKLSSGGDAFAYGGEEVELSVWNLEQAFASRPPESATPSAAKKRKRNDVLLPGELWRAKNVANDKLGLRQPVHNTSLTFISSTTTSVHDIAVGTQLGHVRRYDTRSARRPVADWEKVAKIGGVKEVQKGLSEHELFVRIAGAVCSIATAPDVLVSAGLDRLVRIHSTFPPQIGQQDRKGEILHKIFSKSVPTVAAWDQHAVEPRNTVDEVEEAEVEETDRLWEEMEDAEDESSSRKRRK